MLPRARLFGLVLSGIVLLASCAHTPRSRWKQAGAYTVCDCKGTERQPTPSEADGFADDERVDTYCEGTVSNCRPGSLRAPGHGRDSPGQLD